MEYRPRGQMAKVSLVIAVGTMKIIRSRYLPRGTAKETLQYLLLVRMKSSLLLLVGT